MQIPLLKYNKHLHSYIHYYDDPKNKTNGEFDVVTLDEKGYVFYEVKFRKNPVSKSMIDEEIEQVKLTGLNCYRYVFIARSGFSAKETDEIKLIELNELYMEHINNDEIRL